jgi:RNA-binding protein YhbY
MTVKVSNFQIGKKGVTEGFIKSLKIYFKNNKDIKISVLKNSRSNGKDGRKEVEKMKEEILSKLGKIFKARIIGYTICIKKSKKIDAN